ncbi:MAG: hypothetical protein IIX61_04915, partial [Loktanella sp.]|nr:hypothetical protein [Loktanella sp.]
MAWFVMVMMRRIWLTGHQAGRGLVLRGALVAGHVAILLGLAQLLGLDGFGALIVLWGLALMASTALGFGAPLALLARLGDGAGMRGSALVWLCLGLPLLAACCVGALLQLIWPALPWPAVLGVALAVHLASCIASLLRVLGSVHGSMILRDGAPLLALGLAGLTRADAAVILALAALGLAVICAVTLALVLRHPGLAGLTGPDKPAYLLTPNLWATAVLGMALAQVDIVLGGQFLSAEEIGVYALLRRLANLVALP